MAGRAPARPTRMTPRTDEAKVERVRKKRIGTPRSPRFLNGRPDAVHRPNGRPSLVELTGLERLEQTGTPSRPSHMSLPSCRHAVINFALLRVDEKTARCGPRSLIGVPAVSIIGSL